MLIKNYGISFGREFPGILLLSAVIWLWLVWLAWKEKKISLWMAAMGGGLNLGERLVNGYVVDYWKIPGIPLYNNLNDWLLFLGLTWYLWQKWSKN